jgi:hypothetical protein
MQQGRNVADVLYYYGENNNVTLLNTESLPDIPEGYEFDFVNATALQEAISVEDGKLVAKSGNTYRLLVLDESARNMTLPVLKRIDALVKAGARVSGKRPESSPSVNDDPEVFQKLADGIWQNENVLKGTIGEALEQLKVLKDVEVAATSSKILYRHRQAPGLDIYWLNNRNAKATSAELSFRIAGREPELWNPRTGEVRKVSYSISGDRTNIPLDFESWDAFFIVFGEETDTDRFLLPETTEEHQLTIEGPWTVSFQEGRGAPANTVFETLESWTEQDEPGIKYFSGTATYHTTFKAPEKAEGSQLVLDLGEVKNVADVSLNGQPLQTVWKEPFRVPLSGALKPGENTLEVKVTNVWVNRLIGDAQPGVEQKLTFTTMPFYQADAELLLSGLLGPVIIYRIGKSDTNTN